MVQAEFIGIGYKGVETCKSRGWRELCPGIRPFLSFSQQDGISLPFYFHAQRAYVSCLLDVSSRTFYDVL